MWVAEIVLEQGLQVNPGNCAAPSEGRKDRMKGRREVSMFIKFHPAAKLGLPGH